MQTSTRNMCHRQLLVLSMPWGGTMQACLVLQEHGRTEGKVRTLMRTREHEHVHMDTTDLQARGRT